MTGVEFNSEAVAALDEKIDGILDEADRMFLAMLAVPLFFYASRLANA